MIKFYSVIIMMVLSLSVSAQIKKGTVLLGGQLSYYDYDLVNGNSSEQSQDGGTLSIQAGKAYNEDRVAGISITYSTTRRKLISSNSDSLINKDHYYSMGAFLRQYKKLARDFYFFFQEDAAFIISRRTTAPADVPYAGKVKDIGGSLSVTPGISYQVFTRMQLELSLPNLVNMRYIYREDRPDNPQSGGENSNTFVLHTTFANNRFLDGVGVGFRFLL